MRQLPRTLAHGLVLAALTFAPTVHAQDVDQLFQEGTAALEAGKFDDALRAFHAVWKTRQTHDVAANLAQAEIQLGKHRDAASHLAFALRTFSVSGKPSVRKQIEALLATEKTHVGALRLTIDEAGADVLVDGTATGTSPLEDPLYLEPGEHAIAIQRDGDVVARAKVDAKAGVEESLALSAKKTPPPKPRTVPAFVSFGVGGAGLVLGTISGGVAAANNADLAKKCKPTGGCPESARSELNETKALTTASTVGFVVAGIGAAVGVTLLLLPVKPTPGTQAALAVGPGFVGVKGVF